jgi:hypothetical protein
MRTRRRRQWTKRALNVAAVAIVLLVALPDLLRFGGLPFSGRAVEGSRSLPEPAGSSLVHVPTAFDRGITNPGWPDATYQAPDAAPSAFELAAMTPLVVPTPADLVTPEALAAGAIAALLAAQPDRMSSLNFTDGATPETNGTIDAPLLAGGGGGTLPVAPSGGASGSNGGGSPGDVSGPNPPGGSGSVPPSSGSTPDLPPPGSVLVSNPPTDAGFLGISGGGGLSDSSNPGAGSSSPPGGGGSGPGGGGSGPGGGGPPGSPPPITPEPSSLALIVFALAAALLVGARRRVSL